MDRKVGAALAVAIVGVIVGVVGIVMAKDAKNANQDTQAALEKQIKENGGGRALISICAAGGHGVTAIIEG